MSLLDVFLLGYLVLTVGALLALWQAGARPQMNVPVAGRRRRTRVVLGPAAGTRKHAGGAAITLDRR
jgi:hypothetical protein